MKTLKRLAKVVSGLAFLVLLAVNVQIGSGGNFFGSVKAFTTFLNPDPPMECPFKADTCGWYRYPGGVWQPIVGEPITVYPDK